MADGPVRCVAFLTDYGLADGFVAACRGVLLSLAPDVPVIDITHEVPPGDVRRGAAVLADVAPYLSPAVFLAVVDPGVGTARRAVVVTAGTSLLVGPDNGLLLAAADALGGATGAWELPAPQRRGGVSATFHGRDLFAPAAARLATGFQAPDAGAAIPLESLLRPPQPDVRTLPGGGVAAEVRTVDRFGNVQLAATADLLGTAVDALGVTVYGRTVHAVRARTFGDVELGSVVVYGDSAGRLAVAVNGGRADTLLGVAPGDIIEVRPCP